MKKVAISIGDLNGIGIHLALLNHKKISQYVDPIYCIDHDMLTQASQKLKIRIPEDFKITDNIGLKFEIRPSSVCDKSGLYSYRSFLRAVELAKSKEADAVMTLPIHKKAWELAGIDYKGHTDALRDIFGQSAIMMLGCQKMFVALFTEHIPLRNVPKSIDENNLTKFLVNFYSAVKPASTVAVLGLNPHAGDDGVLGNEERIIHKAINKATKIIRSKYPSRLTPHSLLFTAPMVPDIAFTPNNRKKYKYFVAMYHDQGLASLKALYFDESINISLNLPILRVSVDHGTAFDIAYKGIEPNSLSYTNAIRYISDNP